MSGAERVLASLFTAGWFIIIDLHLLTGFSINTAWTSMQHTASLKADTLK